MEILYSRIQLMYNNIIMSIEYLMLFGSYAGRIRVFRSWMCAAQKRDQHFIEKYIGFM